MGLLDQLAQIAKEFEERFPGAPPLSKLVEAGKVGEVIEKLPDAKRLRAIKEVLIEAEKVARIAPELDKVVMLIREINTMPVEKLDKLEKVLKRIEGILKKAPEELLSFLSSLKEE